MEIGGTRAYLRLKFFGTDPNGHQSQRRLGPAGTNEPSLGRAAADRTLSLESGRTPALRCLIAEG